MGEHRVQTSHATNVARRVTNPTNVDPNPKLPTEEVVTVPRIPKEKEREPKVDLNLRTPKEKEKEKKVKEKTSNAEYVGKPTTKPLIAGTKPQCVKDITRKIVVHQTVRSITLQFAHSGQQAPAKTKLACSFTEKATGLSPSPLLPHLLKRHDQTHQHPQNIRKPRKRNTKLNRRFKKQQRRRQQQTKKSAKLLKHERKQEQQL